MLRTFINANGGTLEKFIFVFKLQNLNYNSFKNFYQCENSQNAGFLKRLLTHWIRLIQIRLNKLNQESQFLEPPNSISKDQ